MYDYYYEVTAEDKHLKNRKYKTIEELKARNVSGIYGELIPNYVLLDIDKSEREINIVLELVKDLNCNILKTDNGIHIYFKLSETSLRHIADAVSPIGIRYSFKHTCGGKTVVSRLRRNGIDREWIKTSEELDEMPFWLLPIKGGRDFSNSTSRNSDLFGYILTLQAAGYNAEQIKTILRIINSYILKDPLPMSELETISREGAFLKPTFFEQGKFLHDEFAKWLIKEKHVVKINGSLNIYKDNKYSNGEYVFKSMLDEIPNLKNSQRMEVFNYLNHYIVEDKLPDSPKYISFNNGVLDIETMELIEHSPDMMINNKIVTNYNPDAKSEIIDRTLLKMAGMDEKLKMLLEEIVGYTFFRRNELGKCFILVGEGGCGKSTFLEMITRMIGDENISSVGLQEMEEKFTNTGIVGKLVNIGDDISNKYIDDNSILKRAITGESIRFQEKGGKPFDYKVYAKLIFASNDLPKMSDISSALTRRLVIVPFKSKFVKYDDYDPYIIDKLLTKEALEYLLLVGIKGLKRILENRGFTQSDATVDENKRYELKINNLLEYVEEGGKFENECCANAYRLYTLWCVDSGYRAMGKGKVYQILETKLGLIPKVSRIGDKVKRIFKRADAD